MVRTIVLAAGGAFMASLVSPVAAQTSSSPLVGDATRVTGPVKYAGTYHVATDTWTRRGGAVSNFGQPDNLYSNTAASGYFYGVVGPGGPAAGGTVIDDGRIPSTGDPATYALGGPGRDVSEINTVQIGYCDLDTTAGVAGWTVEFYERYNPCTFPPNATALVGTATLTGAPSNGCWILDVDVSAAPFVINHDGEGTFDGTPDLDQFGIAWTYSGTGAAGAGLLMTGDPANTDTGWVVGNEPDTGSNTYFGELGGCAGAGSGLDNGDFQWVEDSQGVGGLPGGSGCYFFGGYNNAGNGCGGPIATPYGGFWVELSGGPSSTGSLISQPGCTGTNNNTGVPGQIEVTGSLVASNNDARIRAFDLPANQFGIFASGLTPLAAGTINIGNGTICIDPNSQGGLGRFDDQGQILNSGAGGEMDLDTQAGDWNVASIPTSNGTYAAMAGITSYFQGWHRDPVGAGFNFTNSCSVTWQ